MSLYVQYGCGLSAPADWINFDASPTLRLQKLPAIGKYFRSNVPFPKSVRYGDITRGLPGIAKNSCDGVYCSHVLEHLSLEDFRKAVQNTYDILKAGGIFRCVLPDLAYCVNNYLDRRSRDDEGAAIAFMQETMLGVRVRPKGVMQKVIAAYANSHHLWMWDLEGLMQELTRAGFHSVRPCSFNDSSDDHFKSVEDAGRFYGAIAVEAIK